jgi:hypothetical protein
MYLFFLVLLGLLLVRPRYRWLQFITPLSVIWAQDIKCFCIFFLITALFYVVRFFIALEYMLYSLALYCLLVGIYYLKTVPYTKTFLGKLRILIGSILLALILPLIVKALLLQNMQFLR